MLEDFREQANNSFLEEEEIQEQVKEAQAQVKNSRRRGHFLGMTPVQRFMLSVMLFTLVCLTGVAGLVVTDKVFLAIPGL